MTKSPDQPGLCITKGFTPNEQDLVARLFWQAFRAKLTVLLRPEHKALAFLASVLSPDHALIARDSGGRLLGVAGFKTHQGGLVGGGLQDLAAVYGWPGAVWRGFLLGFMERSVAPDTMLMDGIFVAADARGLGVGTALLQAVKAHALAQGRSAVRLDVIDSNPRAKALYLREGFEPTGQEHLGPLRFVFGFRSATQMVWKAPGPTSGATSGHDGI